MLCVIRSKDFNRVSNYEEAKEIWGTLEVTHEGMNQVSESKTNIICNIRYS